MSEYDILINYHNGHQLKAILTNEDNTPNDYHTCQVQLSLNVRRIRYRPTRSIQV